MIPQEISWQELTIGVAALVALVYVVRTMKSLMRETMQFLYNHMSETTRALGGVADRLNDMATSVDKLTEEMANAQRDAARHAEPKTSVTVVPVEVRGVREP